MTGDEIQSVSIGQASTGSAYYAVNLHLNGAGTKAFADVTTILAPTHGRIAILLDGVVQSAPAVQVPITNGDVSITGNYTLAAAQEFKTVLESGALPVTLEYSESSFVGPTLGQDSLTQGLIAVVVGFAVILAYLLFFYRGLGLVTAGALVVFGIVYLGIFALLSANGLFALSLPGLAGIVLTIGMAADSSILVLERFREELRAGKGVVTTILAPTHGRIAILLDGVVQSAPAVQVPITNGDVSITGNYTLSDAQEFKTVLESGALPVTLEYSESSFVGPTLGQDSLTQGLIAVVVGFAVILAYLLFFYRGLGLVTAGALVVFGIVYLGIFALLSANGLFALSLPGLAGIVLTIGMAADSSILVLERFREELRAGKGVRSASVSGSKHGIGTAVDAGIVSLISALGLFFLTTGSVRGFGLTLALGVLCSFFTLLCFTTPALRLLGRYAIEDHPGFWGVRSDIAEGKGIVPAAKGSAVKGGGADA